MFIEGVPKAPERIRDYIDPSLCVERGFVTRETFCVKTMGEMFRSSICIEECFSLVTYSQM